MRQRILIISPIVVLAMGQTTIRLLFPIWGVWSWLPFWLIYILVLSFFIYLAGGMKQIAGWLAPLKIVKTPLPTGESLYV
jgi:hypothetical protein